MVWDVGSDVLSYASILRSASEPLTVEKRERELPLFVISNDLVICVAGGVGKFRGSEFSSSSTMGPSDEFMF